MWMLKPSRKMQRIMRTELESKGRRYSHHPEASRVEREKGIVLALEEEKLLIFGRETIIWKLPQEFDNKLSPCHQYPKH